MTIGMRQGSVTTEIGSGRLFHSLMSTVAVQLENGNWGTRYPLLMGQLYQGSISVTDVDAAMAEALAIKSGLTKLGPESVIWDIEDLTQAPPWGTVVGTHVTSMAEYFVTSTGRNLLNEIIANLESLKEFGGTLDIISYDGVPRF